MIPTNRTYAPVEALVDELVRCGMRHAVTCPGSRNAPIALTLAAAEGLDAVSVIDERAAGFMALGMAKASGRPVAVTCTSGTAAANLLPAVIEAHEARVPLVVLTADRPPELRDVGAGQAIDQVKLFGSAAKWFVEVGCHEPSRATAIHHRALGCRAYFTAYGSRPGPVHLNMALREPLAPVAEPLDWAAWDGRPDGRPWTELRERPPPPTADDVRELAARAATVERGLIVCGPGAEDAAAAAGRLAAALGWPILAEPTSGVRCGEHDRSHVVAHYDVLLRGEAFRAAHAPEFVLRTGDMPTSKPLRELCAVTAQVVLDPHSAWHEPTRAAALVLHASAAGTCDALAEAVAAGAATSGAVGGARRDGRWLTSWRAADALVGPVLAAAPDPYEPTVAATLGQALGNGAVLWVSSSMPIRDVEAWLPQGSRRLRVLANRGANGIDGVVASAAGAARATGAPTALLIGDLALLHDLGGLLASRRAGIPLTVVCVNNGGGGIFDSLPVAEHADRALYEEHVATPSGIDLAAVAALAGMEHRLASTASELRAAVAYPGLVEVRTDRALNVRMRRELVERVAAAFEAS